MRLSVMFNHKNKAELHAIKRNSIVDAPPAFWKQPAWSLNPNYDLVVPVWQNNPSDGHVELGSRRSSDAAVA